MAVAGRDLDNERRNSSPQPWHNRTPALLGVSVLALAVIGLLIVVATAVAGQFGEPEEAPLDFVEPTYSATATQSATTADHHPDDHQHEAAGNDRHQWSTDVVVVDNLEQRVVD